ncbi:hypothetical protein TUZN_0359 [Thermoproteus uzoniensis 768-20]|uniref:2'-5' RNA ligase n=1 Tax=Thermoproteus uzoniensis (strain 768-20) TaxID=999630 RepID=F2L2R8_THEU7|nr:2'-5' RNA ligase family protein [Thermoproteus uzoniensis]AEA11856.1 hypothetical protein TUZN_0359 [Thermoproteus uzoniensis 768-20]
MPFIYGVLPPIATLRPFEGVMPVKPHITIVKVREPKVVEVRLRPFTARLGDVVLLPSKSRPRYIALSVEPFSELLALRKALEALLGDIVEEKHGDFKPHLSVYSIRLKNPAVEDLAPAIEEARSLRGSAFEVRAVSLIDTTGGEYRPIHTMEFR